MKIKRSRSYNIWRIGLNFLYQFIYCFIYYHCLSKIFHYDPLINIRIYITAKIFIDVMANF